MSKRLKYLFTPTEIEEMMMEADKDGDGYIGYDGKYVLNR